MRGEGCSPNIITLMWSCTLEGTASNPRHVNARVDNGCEEYRVRRVPGTKTSGTKRAGTKRPGTKRSGTKRRVRKASGTKSIGYEESGTKSIGYEETGYEEYRVRTGLLSIRGRHKDPQRPPKCHLEVPL